MFIKQQSTLTPQVEGSRSAINQKSFKRGQTAGIFGTSSSLAPLLITNSIHLYWMGEVAEKSLGCICLPSNPPLPIPATFECWLVQAVWPLALTLCTVTNSSEFQVNIKSSPIGV